MKAASRSEEWGAWPGWGEITLWWGVGASGQRGQGQTVCLPSSVPWAMTGTVLSISYRVPLFLFLLSLMDPDPLSLRVCKKEEKEPIFSQIIKANLSSDLGIKGQIHEWMKLLGRGNCSVDGPQGKSSRGMGFLLLPSGDQGKCRLVAGICQSKAWVRTESRNEDICYTMNRTTEAHVLKTSQQVLLLWDFADNFNDTSASLLLLLSTFVTPSFMLTVHSQC